MDTPQKETVEVLSIMGDSEKSWSIDRYHLMVGISIASVVFIMGGIVWLASGGGKGSSSSATPYPTGELKFSENQNSNARSINDLPYPSVRAAGPLLPDKSAKAAKGEKTSPTPTEAPTTTPTPTSAPSNTSDPTATPTPSPTATPTATPLPSETPTPSQ